jgi:membrane fusion protein, multidrug efflux system
MRSLFLVAMIEAALLVAACGEQRTDASSSAVAASPVALAAAPVVAPAVAHDNTVQATGPIIVEHQIEITSQRDGIVARVFVDTAARVKAGALLAQLDDRQIVANLEAARAKSRSVDADLKNWKAEAEVLKADYVRAQRLSDLGLIAEEQLQHAKYKAESEEWDIKRVTESLNTAHQDERSLELELDKTKIVAPFDALVARRYVREGQNTAKGDRLFWITAEAPLLMRFTLPESFFGRVKAGQTVGVTSPDTPGENHVARVKQISPVIDPSSGTFEVLVELTGNRDSLRPGMTASVRLENPR